MTEISQSLKRQGALHLFLDVAWLNALVYDQNIWPVKAKQGQII